MAGKHSRKQKNNSAKKRKGDTQQKVRETQSIAKEAQEQTGKESTDEGILVSVKRVIWATVTFPICGPLAALGYIWRFLLAVVLYLRWGLGEVIGAVQRCVEGAGRVFIWGASSVVWAIQWCACGICRICNPVNWYRYICHIISRKESEDKPDGAELRPHEFKPPLSACKAETENLEDEKGKWKKQLEEAKQKLRTHENEKSNLHDQIDGLQKELGMKKGQVEGMKQEIGGLTTKHKDVEREMKSKCSEINDLKENKKKLSDELSKLRTEVQKRTTREEELQQKCQRHEQIGVDLTDKVEKVTDENRMLEKERNDAVHRLEERETELQNVNDRIRQMADRNRTLGEQLQQQYNEHEEEVQRLHNRIRQLTDENTTLREEKDETLTRLSAMASAKLRDNNPSIADLSDNYRPTKLAEMFSELYDNEWTNAFTVLEDHGLQERQIISFLLDIVMESYTFCRAKMDDMWTGVLKWFLNENVQTDHQQMCKSLKDGRKLSAQYLYEEMTTEYLNHMNGFCKDDKLLAEPEVRKYITVATKLCLLMSTTDPPVAVLCPRWTPLGNRIYIANSGSVKLSENCHPEDDSKEEGQQRIDDEPTGSEGNQSKLDTETNNQDVKSEIQIGKTEENIDDVRKNVVPKPMQEALEFNKGLFKDYTRRGKFVEFFVWPVMLLYDNGDVLNKGVAQGTTERFVSEDSASSFHWT